MDDHNDLNITALFYEACKAHPDRIAIIERSNSITFQKLEEEVKGTIAYFQKRGIKKGDRILVFLGMGTDLYRIVLAIFSMGAVAVFVDEWVSVERLSICCKMAECKGIIASLPHRIMGLFIAEIRSIPVFLSSKKQVPSKTTVAASSTSANDAALITFTTGSTGIPKAASRSHGFLKAQFDALHPLLHGNINMTMLPIVMLLNLGLGITSVIAPFKSAKAKSFNASKILDLINEHKVESIIAAPYYLLELAKVNSVATTLQSIVSGGAPIYASDAQKIMQSFAQADFTAVYGSTEAEPISHCAAKEVMENKDAFGLLTGKPVASVSLKIIPAKQLPQSSEEALERSALPHHIIGEIIVSGAAVNKTYINDPEAIAENKIITEKTTWHRTGDSGYLDENGQLFLTGRVAQIIHHKGKTYYPFVVENLLKNIEGIVAGTILLVKNKLVLALCVNDLFETNAIAAFYCDEIRYFKSLPFDPRHHSKIDYQKLAAMLA